MPVSRSPLCARAKLKDRKTNKVTINYTSVEINVEKIENLILEIVKKENDR